MKKINSIMKLSNNSSFVILIFEILEFRIINRSTFRRSKFGWGSKFGTTKWRTASISKFQNYVY